VMVMLLGIVSAMDFEREEPCAWKKLGRAAPQEELLIHIFIKQRNVEILTRTLLDVSDPNSPHYGDQLTFDEVNELVAPAEHVVQSVYDWISSSGIAQDSIESSPSQDMIRFRTTVKIAEALLNTQYHYFSHSSTGYTVIRTLSYSIPDAVAPFVDLIGPTTRFPSLRRVKVSEQTPGVTTIIPSTLRTLYGIGNVTNQSPTNQVAVCGFLNQYISTSDLATFQSKYATYETKDTTPNIVGPNKESDPGIEASLDIQYVMAMGANVNTTFWSTPGRQPHAPENEPYLDFLYAVGNDSSAPFIFSMSYGDNEDSVEEVYAQRCNTEFQKAGTRGISMLASSGDGGVGGSQPTSCTTFIPTFPADSPWITAVGGTTSHGPEVAASFSGGGFSNYFAQPSYQTKAVATYLSTASHLPSSSLYNISGAGFPDVAFQAENFLVVFRSVTVPVSGTSCASPSFAGVVSLLNDIRLQASKATLGFLNPLFYSNPSVFNDITEGNNPGCGTNGFYAAVGWDPVTGLGTPNFPSLQKLVAGLP